ncbi:hypothetical protein J7I84_02380 [Arthrobacter sp. ISL-85]|nr:hypothetical protein [Arthrobacter sp. ISL-85]
MATRAAAPLLRRARLLAAALAIIGGLLGMHVLTSGHSSHGAVPNASHRAGYTAVAHPAGAGCGSHAGHAPAASPMDMPVIGTACSGSCPGAQESGAPCIPSAPGAPVTLSPPQATLAVLPLQPGASNAGPAYGYLPPSPTPCDLSISRT